MSNHPSLKEKRLNNILIEVALSNYQHPLLLKACKDLRIPIEQLIPKPKEDFENSLTDLQFNHLEARRRAKLTLVADYIIESQPDAQKRSHSTSKIDSTCYYHRRVRVEENLKQIKQKEDQYKKALYSKSLHKGNRPNEQRKLKEEQLKTKAQDRDEKIKRIFEDRRRATRDKEIQALKQQLEDSSDSYYDRKTQHKPSRTYSLSKEDTVGDVDFQLQTIDLKLKASEDRHKDYLLGRTGFVFKKRSLSEYKKKKENWAEQVKKIHEKNENSKKNRLQARNGEIDKIGKTLSQWHKRRNSEHHSNTYQRKKLEKEVREKDLKINNARQKAAENYMKKGLEIAEKYNSKKNDVDFNISKRKIIDDLKKYKIIEKIKINSKI